MGGRFPTRPWELKKLVSPEKAVQSLFESPAGDGAGVVLPIPDVPERIHNARARMHRIHTPRYCIKTYFFEIYI
jgi:hypothetical protein